MQRTPVVAIIGRPNVGKSSLVNRIVGSRLAIVDDMPGVTRDRAYFEVDWGKHTFTLIDTGGLDTQSPASPANFVQHINDQVMIALEEADAIVLVVDALTGVTDLDEAIVKQLRKFKKPIKVAVNKVDNKAALALVPEFYQLALGDPIPVSAMHGTVGVGDLLDWVITSLKESGCYDMSLGDDYPEETIRLAFVGRPNVGKSSLVNSMLGHNRQIVSDIAGTTRDAIDCRFDWKNPATQEPQPFVLVDTAGVRRRTKVAFGPEYFSVNRAFRAMKRADVTILVMDAEEGMTDQDKKLIELSNRQGNALVLVMNKWDLITDKNTNTLEKHKKALYAQIPSAAFAPIVYTSALMHQRIEDILAKAVEVVKNNRRRIQTRVVNPLIAQAMSLSPPPPYKNKRLKVYYASQVDASPPTFVLFVNDDGLIKDPYKRYIEKRLRENIEFVGSPIVIKCRPKLNADAKAKPKGRLKTIAKPNSAKTTANAL